MQTLIEAGGLYSLAMAAMHLLAWRSHSRDDTLRALPRRVNAILPVLYLSLVVVFLVFAWLSLVHTYELQYTTLGRSILLSIAVFLFLRGLFQVVFMRLQTWSSYAMLVLFIAGGVLYGIPALSAW